MAARISNPILPGFHPDPSIVRVGADYFLATSTFEWFPGVALYHSRDLAHWRPAGHALTRPSQCDLTAVPDSGGIWAPSLSHCDGKFWLVYTVMRTRTGPYKDMVNALVTADDIAGPWSEPVYLNSRGFDPSLFHDEDGRKWLVQIQWDHRKAHPSFGGIVLQEYDPAARRLLGEPARIFEKSVLIEGPNLYRRGGFYYLLLAEGGTSWAHAVTTARSAHLFGPYEADPEPVATSRGHPDHPLQKAGHGELVATPSGEWYLAHLASRPLQTPEGPRCPLGRETCLQKITWPEGGWPRLAGGGSLPAEEVEIPGDTLPHPWPAAERTGEFSTDGPGPDWMTLRRPWDAAWADFHARPGWVRLRGGESPASLHHQSLLARRVTSTEFRAEVRIDFHPRSFSEMAGFICYYDTRTHCYLRLTRGPSGGRVLGIVTMSDGVYDELGDHAIADQGEIRLGVEWSGSVLRFFHAADGSGWREAGPDLDASRLSDDFGSGLHFTGAFLGICAQDLAAHAATADFTNFRSVPRTR